MLKIMNAFMNKNYTFLLYGNILIAHIMVRCYLFHIDSASKFTKRLLGPGLFLHWPRNIFSGPPSERNRPKVIFITLLN